MIPLLATVKGLSPTTWIIIGLGVVIAGLSTTLWIQNVRLDSANNEVTTLELQVKDFKNSIAKQNAGIKALADGNTQLKTQLDDAREANKKRQKELEQLLLKIKNQKVPADTQGRLNYILDTMTENSSIWNSGN